MSDVNLLASWFLVVGCVGAGLCLALTRRARNPVFLAPDPGFDAPADGRPGRVIADWASNAGYDLVSVSDESPTVDRVATECGFAEWHRPGQVCRVRVRDERNELHAGWMFMAGRTARTGEFTPEFIEVAWDE